MTKPTTELACRDMVTGLRITVDGSMQKVEMPKNAILAGLYAAIGCDAVDVVRLADQLDMFSWTSRLSDLESGANRRSYAAAA